MEGQAIFAIERRADAVTESAEALRAPPIDLHFLAGQTMGDSELQSEVLALFKQQAKTVAESMGQATPYERQQLAHGLRGSAAGIGASALAQSAADVENDPSSSDKVARLLQLISEAIAHIDEISA